MVVQPTGASCQRTIVTIVGTIVRFEVDQYCSECSRNYQKRLLIIQNTLFVRPSVYLSVRVRNEVMQSELCNLSIHPSIHPSSPIHPSTFCAGFTSLIRDHIQALNELMTIVTNDIYKVFDNAWILCGIRSEFWYSF